MLILDSFLSTILKRPAFHASAADIEDAMFVSSGTMAFIDAKVPADDIASCARLETAGFRLIDTNVLLGRACVNAWPEKRLPPDTTLRFATEADQSAVGDIAASSFTFSRFHLDPRIERTAANEIKRQWAENFFSGKRGRWMIVAKCGDQIVSFLQLLSKDNRLVIDLIGVLATHQRRGIAGSMIALAARECGSFKEMIVGTQIANLPSLRAYESLGFRFYSANYVFHYHGPVLNCAA